MINQLRESVDIVDVISDYVQLKKQGRNYFGLCPFHGENTPSFSVSSEKQIFHCFGCGAGGNVFTFLMEIDGLTFQESIAKTSEYSNISLDIPLQSSERVDQHLPPEHKKIVEAHSLLTKLYHHLLMNTDEGSQALNYLLSRGFTENSIEKFQIGYSLPEWSFDTNYLSNRGFDKNLLEQAGLIARREDGEYFDRFRGRIMFPLHNAKGNIVGFSARSISEDDQPKYLNTGETILFNKSSLLYNLHEARSHIRKQGSVVMFEGFADVISAERANVKNAVATMGTSLTPQHVSELKRLTDQIILCFDSDQAGIEATFRAGNLLLDKQFTVKVARVPERLDPDDYIQKYGAESFEQEVIRNAQTWMAFLIQFYRMGKNLNNEGEQIKYIEQVNREIAKLSNPVERELYTKILSDEFSISNETLLQQQQSVNPINQTLPNRNNMEQKIEPTRIQSQSIDPYMKVERKLILKMIHDENIAYRVKDMLGDATFYYDEHQAIVTYLFGFYEQGNMADLSLFLSHIPDKHIRTIITEIEMLAENDEFSDQEVKDYVIHVLKYPKRLMIKEKQTKQKEAERNNDFALALQLAKEIIELKKSL